MKEILRILSLVTFAQLMLLAVFLLNSRKPERTGNRLLAAFLISCGVYILYFVLFSSSYAYFIQYKYYFYRLGVSFRLLFGPLLFLYTKYLTGKSFQWNKKTLLHFTPFILELSYFIFTFHIFSYPRRLQMIESGYPPVIIRHLIFYTFNVQVMAYMFACLRLIGNYRLELVKFYSTIHHIKLSWLRIITWSFILMWFIDLVAVVLDFLFHSRLLGDLLTAKSIFISLMGANLLVYKGMAYPTLVMGFNQPQTQPSEPAVNPSVAGTTRLIEIEKPAKYEKSKLEEHMKPGYLEKLLNHMEEEKPYLEFSLTLPEVSKAIAVPAHHVSQLINEKLGCNFYDFVNRYRVEEAKRLLADASYRDETILAILHEVGFNSKSAFYRAFKKETGITPVDFRKQAGPVPGLSIVEL